MDLLVSASFLAAFFAGVAALFAPCCITVLLPTYLGSVFKQKATVFLMTFVYFLGLLTVFVPIGLGASFLASLFSSYHDTIFLLGGVFLTFLGVMLVTGRQFSLPFSFHPTLAKYDFGSVYVLGIFSAIATTCCAPVLAGVVALSALPGSYLLGALYSLAYVMGMVAPLFLIAAFLDKKDFTKKFFAFRRTLTYSFLGKKINVTFANLFSGIVFLAIGILILGLSSSGELTMRTGYQIEVNIFLTRVIQTISRVTGILPEPVWAGVFLLLVFLIINKAISQIISLIRKETK